MEKIYNLAIVGGGPGGIASAVEAMILGIKDIVLLEKGENHSTTLRKFYKDNKRVDKDYKGQKVELSGNIFFADGTKESTLDLFDEMLKGHHIESHFKTEVESIKKQGDIFEVSTTGGGVFKAYFVVISIGKMGQPNKPSYPLPSSLKNIINFNTSACSKNEKIIVVGGGNSAVEYAYFLADNNQVTLNYRQRTFSRINDVNAKILNEYIASRRLKTRLGVDIERVEDSEGKVKIIFKDGSEDIFDRAIYAIGGVAPIDFLKKCGVQIDESGVPIVDENHQSSQQNIYIAGDILFKSGGSIAAALNHGFQISQHIFKNGYSKIQKS
ncbi:cbb3-type cytochrome oxidase assembly protein CcoS [Helicobacter monodelphidis]|uniref:NAD(P)-binding domain-containing protein n=1 Tax=Helicobacter sp. 15-1451 TaxID=2004995 RepID=UPI000DCCE551|nr:NAD(P)-binding domain-containing protein [Helicobacter sp. 15-1451]RAX57269.1 cbb3-type cytochrome oxidase assembly protein CcoS [Helicobacter sp. 15-1451]